MKWLSSALCGPMNYIYGLLCMIKVLITVEIICLTPKEQIFHMSGLLAVGSLLAELAQMLLHF